MRHLFVVVDMSRAMEEADLKPSRLACSVKVQFISLSLAEFYTTANMNTVDYSLLG